MSASGPSEHKESEQVADLYATNFKMEGSGEDIVLGMGTIVPSITVDRSESEPEIWYHSRIRMGPGTARQLYELLDSQFGERKDSYHDSRRSK